jgi:hypothetical protein
MEVIDAQQPDSGRLAISGSVLFVEPGCSKPVRHCIGEQHHQGEDMAAHRDADERCRQVGLRRLPLQQVLLSLRPNTQGLARTTLGLTFCVAEELRIPGDVGLPDELEVHRPRCFREGSPRPRAAWVPARPQPTVHPIRDRDGWREGADAALDGAGGAVFSPSTRAPAEIA